MCPQVTRLGSGFQSNDILLLDPEKSWGNRLHLLSQPTNKEGSIHGTAARSSSGIMYQSIRRQISSSCPASWRAGFDELDERGVDVLAGYFVGKESVDLGCRIVDKRRELRVGVGGLPLVLLGLGFRAGGCVDLLPFRELEEVRRLACPVPLSSWPPAPGSTSCGPHYLARRLRLQPRSHHPLLRRNCHSIPSSVPSPLPSLTFEVYFSLGALLLFKKPPQELSASFIVLTDFSFVGKNRE